MASSSSRLVATITDAREHLCASIAVRLVCARPVRQLIEVISEDTLGKYRENPKMRIQKVENINIALKYINAFISAQGISNQYSAENARIRGDPWRPYVAAAVLLPHVLDRARLLHIADPGGK